MWTVVGHENAVALLKRSLEKGITSHAYLIVGPAHVGKMTLAVNLAQALNCDALDRPCQVCESCGRIAAGKHSDIQVTLLAQAGEGETVARTRITVEQVEQVLHSVSLPPFEGKRKVFIFDGFEHASIGAANKMLKTLEEPVSNVVFILLAANESLVPATIVSRCQRIELFTLPIADVEKALIERWSVAPDKAKLLARLSGGRLGQAVSMAQDESLLDKRNEWLDSWLDVLGGDMDERFGFAAHIVERYAQNRDTVQQKLALLRDWFRDLLLVKSGNDEAITNVDRESALNEMAAGLSLAMVRNAILRIQAAMQQLNRNVNPQLVMEVLMLNLPERGKVKEGKSST